MNIPRIDGEFDAWIPVTDGIPKSKDDGVIIAFGNGSVEMVHIQDYFDDVTNGRDDNGELQYTKMYLHQNPSIEFWMRRPEHPTRIANV